jgi:sugar lactone lactonase YvrE
VHSRSLLVSAKNEKLTMKNFFSNTSAAVIFCAAGAALYAGQTRTWTQNEYADFQKSVIKNLSLRSDGVLTLAPRSKEFYDSSAMYLWGLARDSKGNLYAGGGTGAKLYRIGADGKGKVLAELDALEIHAIALDSKDRVYVGTAPDGKVYRVAPNGKADVFYDPKSKYIWALAFDRQDNLFVATGDPGEIHRVAPDGAGKVFFRSEETHVRSMALDASGNVFAGTAPGGLVLRVSPAGEGFVLYQFSKPEVTTVAIAPDGSVYAAAVGSRQAGLPPLPAPVPAPAPVPTQLTLNIGGAQAVARPGAMNPLVTSAPLGVSGGSEVYRIGSDGDPRRMWSNSQDVVYAIAFDASGRAVLGSGNRGNIYRIESPTTYTSLLTVPATQVTAFQSAPDGRLYAAAGNVGKIYEIDSTPEPQGTIESDPFDAGLFTRWGRLSFEGKLNGGQISIQTRSGNLDQPQKNWSPWSPAITDPQGARVTSPAARFLQWKATLTTAGNMSPALNSVEVAYLPKNIEPRLETIEITPANYKFPAPLPAPAASTLNLPTLNPNRQTAHGESNTATETASTNTPAMQYAKGWIGARWVAADPNGDSLVYTLEIRGVNEVQWKPLKEKLAEKYYSWDSTGFPDGQYRLRITASDAPSNPPGEALTGSLESEPFLIDNTPPKITGLAATRNGAKLDVRWHAADALSHLTKAEYSIDGGDWTVAAPTGGISDSLDLDYSLSLDAAPGEHTIAVRVEDAYDNQAVEKVVAR